MLYNKGMKIGVFGGTFDPVHKGHIAVAKTVIKQLNLDRMIFVPANIPPHKQSCRITDGYIRMKMLREAFHHNKVFDLADIEIKRSGVSYTVDTLAQLRSKYSNDELFLIIGSDMLKEFPLWNNPKKILELATLTVIGRENSMTYDNAKLVSDEIIERFGGTIKLIDVSIPDISSTKIRYAIKNALPINDYVSFGVEKIIYANALYLDEDVNKIVLDLKKRLDTNRFEHTMLVIREAVMLADRYGVEPKKIRIAALLHDCMKVGIEELMNYAERFCIPISDEEKKYSFMLHGILGADAAKRMYGICDPQILNAIKVHTIGNCDMTLFEKIIYLADKIEPSRSYRKIDKYRKLAYEDIDAAVCGIMEHTMKYNTSRKMPIHPDTIKILKAIKNSTNQEKK